MIYKNFAYIYDILMKDVPYNDWIRYLEKIFQRFDHKPNTILDLGCGTGTITQLFAQKGYDPIGIDLSEDMLLISKEKAKKLELDILYIRQDITSFELYGTVDCIISLCDSLNYILNENELLQVFKLVNNYLEPKGLFIFDLNTEYKFKEIMAENIFAEAYEECAYIWDNYYYEDKKINEYILTLFIKEGKNYSRHEEIHYEKAYSIKTIEELVIKAGLKLEAVYNDNSFNEPDDKSERIYFVAREQGKKGEIK